MSKEIEKKKSKMVSLKSLNNVSKSICKIICQNGDKEWTGTGFFMNLKTKNKVLLNCLLTNFHVINYHVYNTIIKLEIVDKIKIPFNIKAKRIIKYFDKPIDITMIEIINEDGFQKYVDYLSYDLNYINIGYDYYLNKEVFILQHPYGEEMYSAIGKITKINDFEFEHDAGTCLGSSGSAIILIENNHVIGIHKAIRKRSGNKLGTFIGKLFDEIVIDRELGKRIDNLENEINLDINKIDHIKNDIKDENPINNLQPLTSKIGIEKKFDEDNIIKSPENTYKNIITLHYKVQKNKNNVILFSKKFLKNNKNKFIMFINNERYDLCYQLDLFKMKITNNILEVKLKKISELKTLESMFEETDLIYISGFSNFDTNKLYNISKLFSQCKFLSRLEDIDFLNTSNIENMNYIFFNCKSLEKIPDISKWDTSKVTHMNYLFSGCEKIKYLPDISEWDVSNVTEMKHMFSNCKSLESLPDISNWDTSNLKYIGHLFSDCESILTIPDIQKWTVKNVVDMNSLFSGCKSLKSIPDISRWKINQVKNLDNIFNGCESVKELPNFSKWKTNKVEKMNNMFKDCKSLKKNPDIKFLKTKHSNNKKKIKIKNYVFED